MSYNHEFPSSIVFSNGMSFPITASQHLLSFSHFYSCNPEVICPHNFHLPLVICKYVGILQLKANVYFLSLKTCPHYHDLGRRGNFFGHWGKIAHVFKCEFGKESQKPEGLDGSIIAALFIQRSCMVFSQIKEIS